MFNSPENRIVKNRGPGKMIVRAALLAFGLTAAVLIFFLYSRAAFSLDTEPVAICGFEEHAHGLDCWELKLICGINAEENDGTDETGELIILDDEIIEDEKDETSETEEGITTEQQDQDPADETETETGPDDGDEIPTEEEPATEPETAEEPAANKTIHIHTEDCYEWVLICGIEEHTHAAGCYPAATTEKVEKVEKIESEPIPESMWITEENNYEEIPCLYCEMGIPHGHVESSGLIPAEPDPPKGFMGIQGAMGIMAMSAPIGPPNPAERWDLRNFIDSEGGIIIKDKYGNIVDPDDPNTEFFFGESYFFSILFHEIPLQFDYNGEGFLIYYLPGILDITSVQKTGPILLGNTAVEVGDYTIEQDADGDYFVKVKFGDFDEKGNPTNKNLIYAYTNVRFWLYIEAQFKPGSESGDVWFGADAKITINLNYLEPKIDVIKSIPINGYHARNETIQYSVYIGAPASNINANPKIIEDIVLIDYPYIIEAPNNKPLHVDTPLDIYSNIAYKIGDGPSVSIVNESGVIADGFTVEWLPDSADSNKMKLKIEFPKSIKLNPGEWITVTYTYNIKEMFPANKDESKARTANEYGFTLENLVTVKSNLPDKTSKIGQFVSKKTEWNVTKANKWEDSTTKENVIYTVTITAPTTNAFPFFVYELTDKPWIAASSSLTGVKTNIVNAKDAYTIIRYRINGGTWKTITDDVIWKEGTGNNNDRSNFEYSFDPPITLNPGENIEVEYTLNIAKLVNNNYTSTIINNKLKYNFWIGNEVTVTSELGNKSATNTINLKKTFAINKTVPDRKGNDRLTWTATVGGTSTGGADVLNKGIITDTATAESLTGSKGVGASITFPKNEDGTYDLSDFYITFYSSPTTFNDANRVGSRVFKASELSAYLEIIDDNTFRFTVPAENTPFTSADNGWNGTMPKIYQVKFVYDTVITTPLEGIYRYTNTIEYENEKGTNGRDVGPLPGIYDQLIVKKGSIKIGTANTGVWTSTIGDGATILNGSVITDILDPRLSFPAKTETTFTVTLYRKPTGTKDELFVAADLIGTFNANVFPNTANAFGTYFVIDPKVANTEQEFRFKIPAANEPVPGKPAGTLYGDIYLVIITYETTLPIPDVGEAPVEYINTVYYGNLDAKAKIPVNPKTAEAPKIEKKSSQIKAVETEPGKYNYEIEYTIIMTVPKGNINKNIYLRDKAYADAVGNTLSFLPYLTDVSVAPWPNTEPIPSPLVYTQPNYINYDGYWYVFFGGGSDINSSKWPYNTGTVVTIKYTMPLSLTFQYGPDVVTVEKYLKKYKGNRTFNTAELKGDYNPDPATVYDEWPIFKEGKATLGDDSVFDYTVHLNPSANLNPTYMMQLFKSGEQAIFMDEFDLDPCFGLDPSCVEYVEKSMYVLAYKNNTTFAYYGPYKPVAAYNSGDTIGGANIIENEPLAISVTGNKITADLSKMYKLNWTGNIKTSTLANATLDTVWYAQKDYRYEIHYQLRLIDPDIRTPQDDIPEKGIFYPQVFVVNEATIISTTQGGNFSNDAKVEYVKRPPLKKKMWVEIEGSDVIEVEIIINETGRRLRPDIMEEAWFKARDEMNGDLAFFFSSIEIQIKDYDTSKKEWGEWRDITNDDKIEYNDGSGNKVRLYDYIRESDQIVDFIIPDERPVKITYKAKITVEEAGEEASFSNEIKVFGHRAVDGKKEYKVTNISAGAGYNRLTVNLFKTDENDRNIKLNDAEFALYMAIPSGEYYGTDEPTKSKTVGEYTFYWLADSTNEGGGKYSFSSDEGYIAQGHKAVYMIIETKVPTHYIKPDKNIFFIVEPMDKTQIEHKINTTLTNISIFDTIGEMFVTNKRIKVDVSIDKTVEGIPILEWFEIWKDYLKFSLEDIIFNLYKVDGDGANIPAGDPIQSVTINPVNGKIEFNGLTPGWYAIVEQFNHPEAARIFKQIDPVYIYVSAGGIVDKKYVDGIYKIPDPAAGYNYDIALILDDGDEISGYKPGGGGQRLTTERFETIMPDPEEPKAISLCADLGALHVWGDYFFDINSHGFAPNDMLFLLAAFDYINDHVTGGLESPNNNDPGRAIAQVILWNMILEVNGSADTFADEWFPDNEIIKIEVTDAFDNLVPGLDGMTFNEFVDYLLANKDYYIDIYNTKLQDPSKEYVSDILFIKGDEINQLPYNRQRQLVILFNKKGATFENKIKEYPGGPKLPETGGAIAFPFAIGGTVMIAGSVGSLLVLKKRKKLAEISGKYF